MAWATLVGPWMALVVGGFQVTNYFGRGRPWVGDALLTVETASIASPIVGGLVCAAAAVDSSRTGRSADFQLVGTARRGSLGYVLPWLWCWIPVAVAQMLIVAGALVWGRSASSSATAVELLGGGGLQVLVIAWFAALGSMLGRFTPPAVAGVAGAVAGYLTVFVSSGEAGFNPLDFGGATVSRVGLTYNWRFLGLQALILTAAMAVFLLVMNRRPWQLNWRDTLRAVIPVGVAGLLFTGVPSVAGLERMTYRPTAPRQCSGTAPEICTFAEQREDRARIDRAVRSMSDIARQAGYTALVPTRFEASSRTYDAKPPARALVLDVHLPETSEGWAAVLVIPAHCPQLHQPTGPSTEYDRHLRLVVRAWTDLAARRKPAATPAQVAQAMDRMQRCGF